MNIYKKKNIIKQCFFEFFGTGLIIFFGIGCSVFSKLSNINLNQFEISCIWGLAITISIYFCSSISGAHLNPAVTIFFWLSSQFSKKKVLPYIAAQIFGSFFFTMIVYYLYSHSLILFKINNNTIKITEESINLASVFCIYPNDHNSFIKNFMIEIFSTAFFMVLLLEFNNKKNNYLFYQYSIVPILIGISSSIINLIISPFSNISLNPARDLGPKIFLSITGWGILSFTGGNNNFLYCFIPIIGPILGTNLGGWIYKKFILNYFHTS